MFTQSPELLFYNAIISNEEDEIRNFFNANPNFDINHEFTERRTPLMLACQHGFFNSMKVLIEKGADVHAKGSNGYEAIHYACLGNQLHCLEALLEVEPNLVNHTVLRGQNSLHIAAFQGHIDIVDYLIGKNADINAVTAMGNSALNIALERKNKDIALRFLQQDDIDVQLTNFQGVSALHRAAMLNDSDLVLTLIEKGADPELETNDGTFPRDLTTSESVKNILNFMSLPQAVVEDASAISLSRSNHQR